MATPTAPTADPAGSSPAALGIGHLFWRIREAAIVGDARTGRIVLWNAAAEQLFGYTAEEAIGLPIDALVPDRLKRRHRAWLAHYRQTGHGSLIDGGEALEIPARRKSGEECWIELSLTPLEENGGAAGLVLALARDVTVRKQVEVEHRQRLRAETERAEAEARVRLATFSADISAAFSHSHTLPEALGRTAEALVRYLDAAFARIWTLNDFAQLLELQASAGHYTHLDGGHRSVPVGRHRIGRIAQERRPYLTDDIQHDPEIADRAWATREGMVAFAGYPLLVEQRLVGVVAVFSRHRLEPDTIDELAGVLDGVAQYVERKRAQETLQRSEARFRALIEHAHDIITILAKDGTIRYESPAIERVLGFEQAELVGQNGFDFVHPDDRAAVWQTFEGLLGRPGATAPTLFRFRHADGSWRWLEAVGYNLLADPSIAGVVVNSRDVTERTQHEDALTRSEARFRALTERSSDMITLQQRDGTITYVSPSTRHLLGYDAEDLLGHQLLEAVHPADRPRLAQLFANLVAQPGDVATARYRMRHQDGSWRWIEATATNLLADQAVSAVVVNRRDVTAEVEAQHLLERRVDERTRELAMLLDVGRELAATPTLRPLLESLLARLKAVVDYVGVAVLLQEEDALRYALLGGPDRWEEAQHVRYRIADFQPAWERLSREESIIIEDVRDESPDARLFRALTAGETGLEFIGSLLWVPLMVKGRIIGVISIARKVPHAFTVRDAELALAIARQAAVAIENARLYETARGAAALEERQRLARELHDSVSQALYAIALNAAATGESLQRRDTRRAARLVGDVRRLARAGLAEMRALIFELRAESLAEEGLVAALTKQAAAIEARHDLKIRTTLGPEPPVALAAKEALYRIAQEALHNTVKHAQARAAEVVLALDEAGVTLLVRDHGRGFDVQESFPGHLGLRSMRERAEAVGGALQVESAPRRGTTIRVSLPLASSDRLPGLKNLEMTN